jgi:NDP-sugar pyrophosphorylase family protein
MQAVILAAGRGKRMGELCSELPKPLLRVHGKTLLEHKIEALPSVVDEVIIVVGYLREKIIESLGDTYAGKRITYVVMDELNGTAPALWLCKPLLAGKTLVLMGDDLYGREDIARAVTHDWCMGVYKSPTPFSTGRINVHNGLLQSIASHGGNAGEYENTGLYVINPELFAYDMVQTSSGEYSLPHTIALAARDIPIAASDVTQWIRITAPEDLIRAEQELLQ